MSKIRKDKFTDLLKLQEIIKNQNPLSFLEVKYKDNGDFNGIIYVDKSFLSSIFFTKKIIFLDASHLSGAM